MSKVFKEVTLATWSFPCKTRDSGHVEFLTMNLLDFCPLLAEDVLMIPLLVFSWPV